MADIPNLLTVSQFGKQFPAFREGGLRHQIFHEEANGLAEAGAIVRIGTKVLIDVDRYFAWVRAQNLTPKIRQGEAGAGRQTAGLGKDLLRGVRQ